FSSYHTGSDHAPCHLIAPKSLKQTHIHPPAFPNACLTQFTHTNTSQLQLWQKCDASYFSSSSSISHPTPFSSVWLQVSPPSASKHRFPLYHCTHPHCHQASANSPSGTATGCIAPLRAHFRKSTANQLRTVSLVLCD
uniref:Ovule protein n=1 Tax=Mesocestoides corti TaxID=53468 RepID=A0A5K3FTL2_MESCO